MDTARREERSSRARGIASAFSWACVGMVVVGGALVLSAPLWPYGELASHFRWHLGLASAALALLTTLLGGWKPTMALVLVALWGVLPEGRLWIAGPELGAGGRTLDVVCANVLRINDEHGTVATEILARDPDVVGLLEMSPEWRAAAIELFGERYPHRVEGLDTVGWEETTWGLILFSKTPLQGEAVVPILREGRRLRPIVRASVMLEGEPVTIDLVHAQRPGSAWRLADRREHFEALCRPVAARHRMILGDLNATSTSPLFDELCESAGVRDSRTGFGRQPTWRLGRRLPGPIPLPLRGPLRLDVAIDHALVSDGLAVLHRETFRLPGSDHRGVHVRVALRRPPPR